MSSHSISIAWTALLLGSFSQVAFAGQCLTTGGAKVGVPCVFPFKARGITYTTCTKAGGFDIPWCSTMVDANGDTVLGNYGDCTTDESDPDCFPSATTAAASADATSTQGSCLTTGGAKVGVPCVFPFKARGITYTTCTKAGGFDIPWCSTMVDANGDTVLGNYGDCPTDESDPNCYPSATTDAAADATTQAQGSCLTTGGSKVGVPCVFPFKTRGVTYTTCTFAGGFSTPWCSTMVDANGETVLGNWGDCPMNDPTCPNDASTSSAPETSPAMEESSPAASGTSPAIAESSAAASETSPDVAESSPAASESSFAASETSPVASESSLAASETSPVASESSLAASETSPAASESSLAASETSPAASESSLAASETSPAASESSLAASETSPAASESSLAASETSPAASESSLAASETSPAASESSLAASETSPAASETSLAASETSHAASESSHAASETSPAASETSLSASDTSPAASESSLAASESSPAASETSIAASESSPAASETSPAASESSLAASETSQAADTSLAASETSPVASETSPAASETSLATSETSAAAETSLDATTIAPCITVSGAKVGVACIFPFKARDVTYNSCTVAGGYSIPWCPTAVDASGNVVLGNWGECPLDDPNCPNDMTTEAPTTTESTTPEASLDGGPPIRGRNLF